MGQKSGHQKRKEKEKDEKITRSLRGTLDSFLIRNSQVGDNRNDHDDDGVVNNVDEVENETNEHDQNETNDHNLLNIYDPRFWDALDQRSIDILAKNGPRRDLSIVKGPKNNLGKRFCSSLYTKKLSNGESCDRNWLVYSKELDKVFCFCCKIFKKGSRKGQLVNEGFVDWTHISERLYQHEQSRDHICNMAAWIELQHRFKENKTIDKTAQEILMKKRNIGKEYCLELLLL